MRKIGILTYFWAENPGTFLQAYGMQKAFERRFPGDRVELINYATRRLGFQWRRRHIYPPYLLEDIRWHRIYGRCQREHFRMSPTGIVTQDYGKAAAFIEAGGYDLIVVGSDTVLQLLESSAATGQPSIYWLPPGLKCRKAACAASASTLVCDALDAGMRKKLADSIAAFDLVGVRDDATWELMEALGLKGDLRLERVPDPTFTVQIDPGPAQALVRRLGLDFSKPTLGENLPRIPLCNALIDHYRAKGFQVVSLIGKANADVSLRALSPFEWAGLQRYFRLTITDRFHGTIFSLRSGVPSVVVDYWRNTTPSGLSKTFSVAKQFGMEQTNYVNLDQVTDLQELIGIADRAMTTFDAPKVAQKVDGLRRQFDAFADKVAGLLG